MNTKKSLTGQTLRRHHGTTAPPHHCTTAPLHHHTTAPHSHITFTGITTNNLKRITARIPHNKITVITGISGSGKSSLAFDTIYAEGQNRFMESFSAYARAQMGIKEKPDFEEVSGLTPTFAVDQRNPGSNPRSTGLVSNSTAPSV